MKSLLLREGLDIPSIWYVTAECPDKEGFLRSHRSLIRTIGHAARNANGEIAMYIDIAAIHMRCTVLEQERRRKIQEIYARL